MSLAPLVMLYIATVMIFWRVVESRGGEDGGDRPGSGSGGGPGWGRRCPPRKPPPDAPVWWGEFERRFAEHVEALGVREGTSSRSPG
jgi:hypothetical protein